MQGWLLLPSGLLVRVGHGPVPDWQLLSDRLVDADGQRYMHAGLLLSDGRLVGAANRVPRRLVLRAGVDQPPAAVVRGRVLLPAGRVRADRCRNLRSRRLLPAGRVLARRLGRVPALVLLRYTINIYYSLIYFLKFY